MAEERNVGLARAPETTPTAADTDATKEELQRRMEEARESITQTVSEIKDTVTTQYQQVRETISESLDWREQVRRRPVPFALGALGAGALLGYSVGGVFKGGDDDDYDYEMETDEDVRASVSASSLAASSSAQPRPYAAQAITGGAYGSTAYERSSAESAYRPSPASQYSGGGGASTQEDVGPDSRPSYSSGYEAQTAGAEENRPGILQRVRESGMIDKFKETKAYDRLQDEIASLGDRFVEELSTTAKNVVLPALLGKLKDLIGIDLSMQREVAQRSKLEHQTSTARADAAEASDQLEGSQTQAAGSGGSSSSYGTSTNRP